MGHDPTDGAKVAHRAGKVESVDDLVARRLEPVRVAADLATTLAGIDALGADTVVAVVAVTFGSWPNAVAILDGTKNARDFVHRFSVEGRPSLWPLHSIIAVKVFAVAPEDVAALADIQRGRWHLPAAATDDLIDPTAGPVAHAAGGGRAARRREAMR